MNQRESGSVGEVHSFLLRIVYRLLKGEWPVSGGLPFTAASKARGNLRESPMNLKRGMDVRSLVKVKLKGEVPCEDADGCKLSKHTLCCVTS